MKKGVEKMITKKRLKELIKEGATIYTRDSDVHLLNRWHFVLDGKLYESHRDESEYLYDLEELFETEEDADLIDSYSYKRRMREIKFRGKIKDTNRWAYGVPVPVKNNMTESKDIELVQFVNYDELDYYIPCYESWDIEPATLGQYTGLKDKNGKEIYEGDIVKFKHDAMGEWLGNVFWDENERGWNAYLKYLGEGEPLFIGEVIGLGYSSEMYEVIGNIYDNPELLEVKG